jgi:hypothetical protein
MSIRAADLMQDHGLVAEIDERLGHAKRQRPQASAKASHENERLHGCSPAPVKMQQNKNERLRSDQDLVVAEATVRQLLQENEHYPSLP